MKQAIETPYNGYFFRSQLEARWALFFDQICVPYIYELDGYKLAEGLVWYRPDFWLPRHGMYVEIKPHSPNRTELDKAYHLALERQTRIMILCGDPRELLEVHEYSCYPLTEEVWGLICPLLKDDPQAFSLIEHISEECIVFYQKGDLLHYYVGFDYDSLRHACDYGGKPDVLTYFWLGHRRPEDDVVWEAVKDKIDLCPEITELVPREALRARMHQFWRPKRGRT